MSAVPSAGMETVVDETRFRRQRFTHEKFYMLSEVLAVFRPVDKSQWLRLTRKQCKRLASVSGPNQEEAKKALESWPK